ncbi:hypothetical protein PENTCL1PPCAC_9840 [Pristionchus entomophagus]|uniref:Potassium channel domain-containing protein n=1 Tax=Pristionchus entomophagus TaxID=358040 RepID=A0AAV5SWZ5_9BILA|nr:hypothetical protein PENTCL1PPCAC_9840 [Pristionchus entomophagus]
MFAAGSRHRDSCASITSRIDGSLASHAPEGKLAKIKYYYDYWGCRKFVPVVLLVLYSFAGAAMFFYIEHENEQIELEKEHIKLEAIRNETLLQIRASKSLKDMRGLLAEHERRFDKERLMPGLPWDFWGALFFVGTLYTTIGYGNIFPRTSLGKVMSVVYAIVGIPLVLAILSQCGRAMTNWLSEWWTRRQLAMRKQIRHQDPEAGVKEKEELEEIESRTIPVSLALGLCIGWVSACAGLFLIWEAEWSYFDSLYFFCISLSTIGLGDVVPRQPHMLIIMFWLVIIGLCIVSMLLSVIQIKMEEYLYNFMIRMQKKYKEALEDGRCETADDLLHKAMDKQPWFMRNLAPMLLNDKQQQQIEQQAETYERVSREWNNKTVQADFGPTFATANAAAQACEAAVSVACDPISASIISVRRGVEMPTQWSEQSISPPSLIPAPPLITRDDDDDSISDAPSLPYDSESPHNRNDRRRSSGLEGFLSVASSFEEFNNNTRKSRVAQLIEQEVQTSRKDPIRKLERTFGTDGSLSLLTSASAANAKKRSSKMGDQCAQTDIAQFQIDEILLRLHSMQQIAKPVAAVHNRTPSVMERSVETTASILDMMFLDKNDAGTQYDRSAETALMDQSVLTDVLQVLQATAAVQCGTASSERRHIGTEAFESQMTSDFTTNESQDTDSLPFITNEAITQSAIESRDVASSPICAIASASRAIGTTPPPERTVISTQTSLEQADVPDPSPPKRKPTIVCEAEVSTHIAESMTAVMDESTQMTPPSPRRSVHHNFSPPLGRSDSLQSLCGSIGAPMVECTEVVVQTDDSYLKIARRLDQYRSNKTQFLPVCAAEPLSPNSAAAAASTSAGQSRNYSVDPQNRRRSSRAFSFRKKKEAWNHASAQTSMDPDRLASALAGEVERARSSTPSSSCCDDHPLLLLVDDERQRKAALKRKASLPAGIPRGRVAEFVQAHEKGITNPGVEVEKQRRVTIVRQHSLGVGCD